MAIVATAKIQKAARYAGVQTRSADRRVRRDGLKASRSAASLFARLEAPRYDVLPNDWADDVEGFDPERLVLVFTNEPPIVLGTPSFDSLSDWRPRGDNEPWNVPMGYDHEVQFIPRQPKTRLDLETGEFVEVAPAAHPAPGCLAPILSDDECAAAAYRALLAEAHEFGPAVEWDVQLWSDEKHTWVRYRYIGTESAMRRNFPDWEETERMRACGVVGARSYVSTPAGLEHDGHEEPAVPYRIRRV